MEITLKNVKHAAFAPEKTNCFSASIYIDGIATGTTVTISGYGGSHIYHDGNAYERLSEYSATLPDIETDIMVEVKPFTYEPDADALVNAAFAAHLNAQCCGAGHGPDTNRSGMAGGP